MCVADRNYAVYGDPGSTNKLMDERSTIRELFEQNISIELIAMVTVLRPGEHPSVMPIA